MDIFDPRIFRSAGAIFVVGILCMMAGCELNTCIQPFCCTITMNCDTCYEDGKCGGSGTSGGTVSELTPFVESKAVLGSTCSAYPNCARSEEVWLVNPVNRSFEVRLLKRTYVLNQGFDPDQYDFRTVEGNGDANGLDRVFLGCSEVKDVQGFCNITQSWYAERSTPREINSNIATMEMRSLEAPDACVKMCELGSGCLYDENKFPAPKNILISNGIDWAAQKLVTQSSISLDQAEVANKFGEDPSACVRNPTKIGFSTIENTGEACSIAVVDPANPDFNLEFRIGERIVAKHSMVDPTGSGPVRLVQFDDPLEAPFIQLSDPSKSLRVKSRLRSVAKTEHDLIFQTDNHCVSWRYQ